MAIAVGLFTGYVRGFMQDTTEACLCSSDVERMPDGRQDGLQSCRDKAWPDLSRIQRPLRRCCRFCGIIAYLGRWVASFGRPGVADGLEDLFIRGYSWDTVKEG